MRRDVALAAGFGVAIEIVDEAANRVSEPRQAAVHALQHAAIANHDLHKRGQVVGRPRTGHVRLAGADTARQREVGVEALVLHVDSGAQIGLGGALAEWNALATVFNHETAVPDSRQTAKHRTACETINDRGSPRPRGVDAGCDYGIRLGHLDASNTRARIVVQVRAEARRRT